MGGGAAGGMGSSDPGAGGGSGVESEDISGDVSGSDPAVSELASKYTEEQLIKALYQLTKSTSMMEGMSYSEFEEAVSEFMEDEDEDETKYGESDGEDDDDEDEDDTKYGESDGEDDDDEKDDDDAEYGETVSDGGEDVKGAKEPPSKGVTQGKKPKGKQVDAVTDHGEVATGTLNHSERTVRGRERDNLQARVAELEEELARQKRAMREAEITSFCESVYSSGRLTPKIVPQGDLVRFMETLNAKNTVNFSEAGKTSQYDFFRGVLEALPSMVSFEEVAPPASAVKRAKAPKPPVEGYVYDPNTADLHAKALEYQEKNSGTSYENALRAVLIDS